VAGAGRWAGRDTRLPAQRGGRATPRPPGDEADARRRIEPGGRQDPPPPWAVGPPPPQRARAGRGHGRVPLRLFARATAYRLPWARAARGGAAVGWHRWRRQRRAQTRAQVIGCAHRAYGLLPLAHSALRLGVQRTHVPPAVGSRQQVVAKCTLPAGG